MQIKHEKDGKQGRFFIESDDEQVGEMDYTLTGRPVRMVINHTEVDEAYEGKGLGTELVKAGVNYARRHRLKILPLCAFAKKVFDATPEFADVLY